MKEDFGEGTMSHSVIPGWWTNAGTFESLWLASNMAREKSERKSNLNVSAGEP